MFSDSGTTAEIKAQLLALERTEPVDKYRPDSSISSAAGADDNDQSFQTSCSFKTELHKTTVPAFADNPSPHTPCATNALRPPEF